MNIIKVVLNPNREIPEYLMVEHNGKILCYKVGDNFVKHDNPEFLKMYAAAGVVREVKEIE